ncbi:MAG TPA: NAD(P)H-dependent oxidoreductase [Acidimicrobiia bacterium]
MVELGRPVRIVAFAGSTRSGSFNQLLVDQACVIAEELGAETDSLLLKDFPMPIYNADFEREAGVPETTRRFVARVEAADSVLIASPEYNGGYTPLFKNTLDWATRIDKLLFLPRRVGISTTTPGVKGGVLGLAQMEAVFRNIYVTVHEPSLSIPHARRVFVDGALADEEARSVLEEWVKGFVAASEAQALDPPQPQF